MSVRQYLFVVLCVWVSSAIHAQTDEFLKSYDEFKQQAQANYEDFRQKVNKEYADWMSQAWEWHQKIEPMPRPKDDILS